MNDFQEPCFFVYQPVSQSVSQPITKSVSQSANQSISLTVIHLQVICKSVSPTF